MGPGGRSYPDNLQRKTACSSMIGPPKVPPNWLRFMVSRRGAKAFRALNFPLRTNSKRLPWKLVRARFGHQADRARRFRSVLSGHRAGFDFEFLQGIGKRHRTCDAIERIIVICSIQGVIQRPRTSRLPQTLPLPVERILWPPAIAAGVAAPANEISSTTARPFSGSSRIRSFSTTWPTPGLRVSTSAALA